MKEENKLIEFERINNTINNCEMPILAMVVSCNEGSFPFPELKEELNEAELALNSLQVAMIALNEKLRRDEKDAKN